MCNQVSEKQQPGLRKAQSSQWAPEDEELRQGIDFINSQAPEGDALNEQTFWMLTNVRDGSNTPIAGWPEAKVRDMCRNKSRGVAGARPNYDYPLRTYSMKSFMSDFLLPLLYPLLVLRGVMMIGWPGVGKTPAVIVMMLAIGRYHISQLGLHEKPSWRRAKSLDNFRHRVPQIHDGVFLDYPRREKIDMADLKSFMTAKEDQTCSGRYNDVKLDRGQVRAYAGNHLTFEDEPEVDARTAISSKEFMKMLGKTFPGEKEADVIAVLKRSVVFVLGKNALYLRLPSQHEDCVVHRIVSEDVHWDVLAPHDKYLVSQYKTGNIRIKGDDFEGCIAREQKMIHNSFMNMSEVGPKDYIEHCGREVQRALRPKEPSPNRVRILPSSPSSDDNELPATVPFSMQLATPDMPRKRLLNSSAFVYPSPARRLSRKTSVTQPINQEEVTPDALTSSAAPSSGLGPVAHALRANEVPDDNIAPEPATSEAGDEGLCIGS